MTFFSVLIHGTQGLNEPFNFTLNIDSGLGGQSSAQNIADRVRDQFEENWDKFFSGLGTLNSKYTSITKWTKVTAYERPITLPSTSVEVAEAIFEPALAGNASPPQLPPETAVCVSLLTGTPGRSHRGRFYLPAPVAANMLANDGRLATGNQDVFVSWAAAFIGGVNDVVAGLNVVVWSRKLGQTFPVTYVQVGDQFDTQNRRQNSAPETYKGSAVSGI